MNEYRNKLKEYGFSDYVTDELLKGKLVLVSYGKVKFNKKTSVLFTYYQDGRIKQQKL